MKLDRKSCLKLAATALLAAQTGCVSISGLMGQGQSSQLDTSLLEAQGYAIPEGGMATQTQAQMDGRPQIVLEVRGEKRHLERIPLPMDRGVTIEELVQQAGLHEKIGKLNVTILRPNGQGNPPVSMTARTDGDGKVENIGLNYALLPGDHVVAVENDESALQKFISSQFGR